MTFLTLKNKGNTSLRGKQYKRHNKLEFCNRSDIICGPDSPLTHVAAI